MWQPLGEHARWRILYDMLCAAEVEQVLTYAEMAAALGVDPATERAKIQMAMRRAAEEHEKVDKRSLDVVPGRGYRVVPATENIGLARRHQKKAGNSLVRGHSKAANADLSQVDENTRSALETIARAFALQMDFNRRLAVNQQRLAKAVESVSSKQDRTAEEVAELRARLDRLTNIVHQEQGETE